MKFIVNRQAFVNILGMAAAVTPSRSPKPILQCVRIIASKQDGTVTVHATDCELSVMAHTGEVDVSTPGTFCVPCASLLGIIDGESDTTITLSVENDVMHIRSSDASFKVFGYPAQDFPDFPANTDGKKITIPATDFVRAFESTGFAMDKNTSRYSCTGVLLRSGGKAIDFVATDGNRLAWNAIRAKGDTFSGIVPPKFVRMASRVGSHMSEPVEITTSDTGMCFKFGHAGSPGCVKIATALVEGTFPPFEQVVPKTERASVFLTFNREKMIDAVTRALRMSDGVAPGVPASVSFSFDGTGCTVAGRKAEAGESSIRFETSKQEGSPHKFAMKGAYLLDALESMTGVDVVMDFEKSSRVQPGCLREDGLTHVIMPVHIPE